MEHKNQQQEQLSTEIILKWWFFRIPFTSTTQPNNTDIRTKGIGYSILTMKYCAHGTKKCLGFNNKEIIKKNYGDSHRD